MIANNCFLYHWPFVIWTDNLSDISTSLHRQAHDVEVLGKLCDKGQPSIFCSSTQSSMLNTPSEGPALLHVLH
jgi:hypothetical protein